MTSKNFENLKKSWDTLYKLVLSELTVYKPAFNTVRNLHKFFQKAGNLQLDFEVILGLTTVDLQVTCFFKQFEKDQVFMEDISGINFNFSPLTFDLLLVNVDSLIFLNNVKMISR